MSDKIDQIIKEVKESNSKLEKNTNNLNLNKFERVSANSIMPIISKVERLKAENDGYVAAFDTQEEITKELRAELSKVKAELTKANERIAELLVEQKAWLEMNAVLTKQIEKFEKPPF